MIISRLICVVISIAMVLTPVRQTIGANLDHTKNVSKNLGEMTKIFTELRSQIKRSEFETEALVEELEYDGDKIVDFVSKNISFEQYVGVMRGAVGTLMSNAGNSADQSLLLATLLNLSGYESQIVRSNLGIPDAKKLISSIGESSNFSENIFKDIKKAENIMNKLEAISGKKFQEEIIDEASKDTKLQIPEELITEVEKKSSLLLERVSEKFVKHDVINQLAKESVDYYWVQWRLTKGSKWSESHPAFGGKEINEKLKIIDIYKNTFPSELQTKLTMSLSIERSLDDKSEVIEIAKTEEMPTANLTGEAFTVTNIPNTIRSTSDVINIEESLRNAKIWTPMLNGSIGKLAFDLQGNVIDTFASSTAQAGLFQSLGKKFSDASVSLGAKAQKLEHVWLEYEMGFPNGTKKIYKTDLFAKHLLEDNGEIELIHKKAALLTSTHSIMLATGKYNNAYIFDKSLKRLLNAANFILANNEKNNPENWEENIEELETKYLGQMKLYSLVDSVVNYKKNEYSYRDKPSIVAYSQFISFQGKLSTVVNIVSNPRITLKRNNNTLTHSQKGNVLNGVLESILEKQLLEKKERDNSFTASLILTDKKFVKNLVVIDANNTNVIERMEKQHADSMRMDINAGYLVVIPESMLNQEVERPVWWRVHPETGETLAMTTGGYGATMTEYIIKNIIAGMFAAVVGYTTFMGCVGGDKGLKSASTEKIAICGVCGAVAAAIAWIVVGAAGSVQAVTTVNTPASAIVGSAAWKLRERVAVYAGLMFGSYCSYTGYTDS